MPRRAQLSPEEWFRRVQALRDAFAEVQEAVERQKAYLWAKAQEAGSHRIIDGWQRPDAEGMARLHGRVIALENQWLEAMACLGHRAGLPNMYGRDGRRTKVPKTAWSHVPSGEIASAYRELKAARAAKDADRLARAILATYHIPPHVLQFMEEPDRIALETRICAEAELYVRGVRAQSAFTGSRLEADYAERLGVSVSTLQRHAGVRSVSSKR